MRSEFLIVAQAILNKARRSLSAREIIDLAQASELFSDKIAGHTPHQTMKSKLSVHIRRFGRASPFVRTAPGRFALRSFVAPNDILDTRPLRPPKSAEMVLTYAAVDLDRITTWHGFNAHAGPIARKIFSSLEPQYRHRFDVEQDGARTQILTYVLVCRRGSVLSYRRGTYSRVERYLQGAFCVGFGGHVTDLDRDLFDQENMGIFSCVARELREELELPATDDDRLDKREGLKLVGVINDDSSDVGKRHLAFVFTYEVSDGDYWARPRRGEKAITRLRWLSAGDPKPRPLWHFEYWSQLCLRAVTPDVVADTASYRVVRRSPLVPPHVLCLVGPVGSGKSLTTGVLAQEYGYQEVNSGKILAEILDLPPVPTTPRADFQAAAERFIQTADGPSTLALRLAEAVRGAGRDRMLVDGLRHTRTYERLREFLRPTRASVVYLVTPVDVAWRFYMRREGAKGTTFDEFLRARNAPVEREVEGFLRLADAVIYNATGKWKHRTAVRRLMRVVGIAGGRASR